MWYSHNEYSLTNNETQIFKTYSHQNMRPERLHPFHFTFPPNMHFLPFYEFCGLYQRFRAHLMLLSLHWPISFNYLIIVTMWVDQRELFQERFLCLCLHDLVLVQNFFMSTSLLAALLTCRWNAIVPQIKHYSRNTGILKMRFILSVI